MTVRPRNQGSAPRHVPQRTCAACRSLRPKRELVRIVRHPDGSVGIDLTGKQSGRGVYLCRDARCWTGGLRRNVIADALKTEIKPEDRKAFEIFAESLTEPRPSDAQEGEYP